MARGKALGCAGEQKPAPAAYVEHLLVAAPGDDREHHVAMTQLAHLDVVEKEHALDQQKAGRPEEHGVKYQSDIAQGYGARSEEAEQKTKPAEEKEVTQDRRGVDAVVGCKWLRRGCDCCCHCDSLSDGLLVHRESSIGPQEGQAVERDVIEVR